MQRGIERAGLDLEQIVGLRADGLADAVAMSRAPLQRAEDEHVERALQQLEAAVVGRLRHGSRHPTSLAVDCLLLSSGVPPRSRNRLLQWEFCGCARIPA